LHGTPISVVSASIFGSSLIILYLSSTLYHASRKIRIKAKLNKFDHSAIYILIAGTYTPFTIVLLQGGWGWSIFGIQWGLAIAGIIFKLFWYKPKYRVVSAWAYVGMGLVMLIAIKPLIDVLSTPGLIWLSIGGLVYITGVFFYLSKKIPFSHGIWHLFVMGGSIAHFIAIYNYVLPNLNI
jgi:hemolysin III